MKLTASDRSSLIKLASELPKGSDERRAILSGLSKVGMEFDTKEALEAYLKDHPGADKSLHSVKKQDKGKLPPKAEKALDNHATTLGKDKNMFSDLLDAAGEGDFEKFLNENAGDYLSDNEMEGEEHLEGLSEKDLTKGINKATNKFKSLIMDQYNAHKKETRPKIENFEKNSKKVDSHYKEHMSAFKDAGWYVAMNRPSVVATDSDGSKVPEYARISVNRPKKKGKTDVAKELESIGSDFLKGWKGGAQKGKTMTYTKDGVTATVASGKHGVDIQYTPPD